MAILLFVPIFFYRRSVINLNRQERELQYEVITSSPIFYKQKLKQLSQCEKKSGRIQIKLRLIENNLVTFFLLLLFALENFSLTQATYFIAPWLFLRKVKEWQSTAQQILWDILIGYHKQKLWNEKINEMQIINRKKEVQFSK